MNAVAELPRDDDSPPPSGVRLRAFTSPGSPSSAAVRVAEPDAFVEALALVGEDVFLETREVVRTLSPLQGAWLKLGVGQLGAAVLTVGAWSGGYRGEQRLATHMAKVLRDRWPELVPGVAAMDCLAGVMVDAIC